MKYVKRLSALVAVATIAMGIQVGTSGVAHAATDTDLSISAYRNFANQSINFSTCNGGSTAVKEIVFSLDATNFVYDSGWVSPFDTPPTDPGTFDVANLTWNGELGASECVALAISGNETGSTGDEVTSTISIVSSIQVDDTPNVDANSANDSATLDPFNIVALPDLKAESHLVTTGTITETSEVEYQVDVSNVGGGAYHDNGFNIFAFTMPEGASFVSATDLNTGDVINASDLNCGEAGVLGVDIVLPGLEGFAGRHVAICQLEIVGGTIPADDTIYPFKIKIVAGAALAAGSADVVGILEGNDSDTFKLFQTIASGGDIAESILNDPNNNVFHLAYDPDALAATSTLCPGQSATSTDGTACFRISFNKPIYEPSFTIASLTLSGSGTIQSLEKIGDNLWEVRVTGITKNSSTTLQLVSSSSPYSVKDYSAVIGNVFVLGESTVRYESDAVASGSLPETGFHENDFSTALFLLTMGVLMVAFTYRKKQTA